MFGTGLGNTKYGATPRICAGAAKAGGAEERSARADQPAFGFIRVGSILEVIQHRLRSGRRYPEHSAAACPIKAPAGTARHRGTVEWKTAWKSDPALG
jgi:hypothetical protein